MAVELAVAYVNLVPTFRGGAAAMSRELGGPAAAAGRTAGATAGREFAGGVTTGARAAGAGLGRGMGAAGARAGEQAGRSFRQRFEASVRGIGADSFSNFGRTAVVAGGVAAAGFVMAGKAAANLNAAVATSEQIFEGQAAAIEQWSRGASDGFGQSQRAALESAAAVAAFGKQAGLQGPELTNFSTQLVELAADLAAMKNTTVEDAMTALQSGLAGETEPLRRYQILLSDATLRQEAMRQGIIETTDQALTPQQRVLAAHAVIMQQSGDAQGQFAREQGELGTSTAELAAKFEDAQAAIGQGLLPVLVGAADAATSVVDVFRELSPETQAFVGQVGGAAAASVVAAGGLALLVGGGMRAADTFREFSSRTAGSSIAMRGLSTAVRGGAGAFLALGAIDIASDALNRFTGNAQDAERATERVRGAVETGRSILAELDSLIESRPASLNPWTQINFGLQSARGDAELPDGTVQRWVDLDYAIREIGKQGPGALAQLRAELVRQGEQLDPTSQAWKDLQGIIAQVDSEFDAIGGITFGDAMSSQWLDRWRARATEAASATGEMADEEDAAEEATKALDAAMGRLSARQQLATLGFDAAAAAAEGYTASIERSTGADDLLSASLGAGSALRDLREGLVVEKTAAQDADAENDHLSRTLDALRDSAAGADPKLSALGIRLGQVSATADAFSESIENSSGFDDQVTAAVSLGTAFRDFSRQARRLPPEIDLVGASLGKYRTRVSEAINTTVEAGNAAVDYLQTMIRSGRSFDEVRSEGGRLRGEFERQFRQLGLNEQQVQKYIDLLGLTPRQINTAIRVSGAEAARFKINSYLQLLEGKIPAHVATAVTAAIEREDLDGAAQILARFAATNPVPIEVKPQANERDVEEAKAALEPLFNFSWSDALMGKYTQEQTAWLEGIVDYGDKATGVLAELVKLEDGEKRVMDTGAQMRAELVKYLQDLNVPPETIRDLIEVAGLSDIQISAAVDEASFASTTFKLQTLIGIIQNMEGSPTELLITIAGLMGENRFEDAANLGSAFATDIQDGVLSNPIIAEILGDAGLARLEAAGYKIDVERMDIEAPVGADTSEAERAVNFWRLDQWNRPLEIPVKPWLDPSEPFFGILDDWRTAPSSFGAGRNLGTKKKVVFSIPGRASGGDVEAGEAYIVGEKRAELFVPDQSGVILPSVPSVFSGDAGGSSVPAGTSVHVDKIVSPNPRRTPEALAAGVKSALWLNGLEDDL